MKCSFKSYRFILDIPVIIRCLQLGIQKDNFVRTYIPHFAVVLAVIPGTMYAFCGTFASSVVNLMAAGRTAVK